MFLTKYWKEDRGINVNALNSTCQCCLAVLQACSCLNLKFL